MNERTESDWIRAMNEAEEEKQERLRGTRMNTIPAGMVLPAGIYQHYKGGYYQVIGMAENSDKQGELSVVYISLSGMHLPGLRMRYRDLKSWLEPVPGGQVRYLYVGQEIPYHLDHLADATGGGY